ncbi:MAG: mandelate racemase/muconate lactonizing enzyme family protein [Candidatus Dormibacter sp.]
MGALERGAEAATRATAGVTVTDVRATVARLTFTSIGDARQVFGASAHGTIDHVVVRLRTSAGVTGYGEAYGYSAAEAVKTFIDGVLSPLVVGSEVGDCVTLSDRLQRAVHLYGRQGVAMYAISGIDIALWDAAAQLADVSLARLFDATVPASLPAYASLASYRNPTAVGVATAAAVSDGFTGVKLHDTAIDEVQTAREASPNGDLMVDANCHWSLEGALVAADQFEHLGLAWLEEPVWPPEDGAALASLRVHATMPIAAGENLSTAAALVRLIEGGAVDIIQPSVVKVGGVTEFLRVLEPATAAGVRVAPHSPYFGPGLAATIQLLCMIADPVVESRYVTLSPDLFDGALLPQAGRIAVPPRSGIGVAPDAEVLAAFGS